MTFCLSKTLCADALSVQGIFYAVGWNVWRCGWNNFVFDTNVTKLCYQYKNTVIQNMQKTVDKYRTTCYIDITTG